MLGIDVSHYQGIINWEKVKRGNYKFAILKCTEGTSFKDKTYEQNKKNARKNGILVGSYHFANHNDPKKEAVWFIKNVGDIEKGELLVLDSETGQSPEWCLKFLKEVEKVVGFKPIIYLNESTVKRLNWSNVVKNNFGLWVAKYASSVFYVPYYLQRKPVSDEWPFWAIWQYSSRANVDGINGNVDVNYTRMNLETLKKYGKK